nr:MAG TPA: hypothetical protein [Caudoviricetes sp.]
MSYCCCCFCRIVNTILKGGLVLHEKNLENMET